PKVRPLPDEATRQLSGLVARRSQILAMIVAEQQRKKHRPNPRMLASIERLLAALQKELSDLDGQIREAIQTSPLWREKDRLMESCRASDRRSPAGPRGRASPANGKARASSAADAPACAARSSWGPWSPCNTIAPSRPSPSASSPPEKRKWSR